jgi:insertion element IS1 protein InsB
MNENNPSCSRFGVSHFCPVCKSIHLIKSGKTATGKQRYSCKNCDKRFITEYTYLAYKSDLSRLLRK